jgi:hypothetical protein
LFRSEVPLSRDAGRVALAGRFVAFTSGRCRSFDHDTGRFGACSRSVKVYDARRDTLETAALRATTEGTVPPLDGMVVTADGWAAWMTPSAADETVRQVWVRAPHASAVNLAEGPTIDRRSLAAAARMLYWTDGLQPRSAPLRRADGLAVGAGAGAGVSAARPAAAGQLCVRGRTVLASSVVRLVRGPARDDYRFGLYACKPVGGTPVHVFDSDFVPGAGELSGRFLVHEQIFCDIREPYDCEGSVLLYDAARRRSRLTSLQPNDGGSIPAAGSMLVTARGAAAWIRAARSGGGVQDVWLWRRGDRPRIVASGAGIVASSLAAGGQRLYWEDEGQARSMTFPR